MTTETSLTIIALTLIALVIFLIVAAIYLIQLLVVLKKTTQSVEGKINPLLDDAKRIVDITGHATELVRDNIELTKPLFHSIGKISQVVEGFSNRYHRNDMHHNSMNYNFEAKKEKIAAADWAEWVGVGLTLIQRLRNK